MREVPLTKGKVALIDDEDFERVSQYKWLTRKIRHYCYASRDIELPRKADGRRRRRRVFLHRFIMNPPGDMCVDHINGDPLDNRRVNMRICTPTENKRNRGANRGKKTLYKGIDWMEPRKKRRLTMWPLLNIMASLPG